MNATLKSVKETFTLEFSKVPSLYAAPGRINIIGEHTDYNEGYVLPAAIDKRIYLAILPNETEQADIISIDFDERVRFAIDGNHPDLPHWAVYPYGIVKELQDLGATVKGFSAVFGGDIPTGAGMSSSAAIESAFGCALNVLFDLKKDKLTLARVGQSAEHNHVGVRCGIMDQFASFFGRKDHVIRLDCRTLEHEYYPLALEGYQLVLADTQVKHSLASSEYNTRRRQCEEGVQIIQKKHPSVQSLRDVSTKELHDCRDVMDPKVFDRCSYVVEENIRVLQSCQALENGDIDRLGKLMFQSHEGLQNKYAVSCDELDVLVDHARKVPGIAGARMMGGGFGGCTINLLKSTNINDFKDITSKGLYEAFGQKPMFYAVNIGHGAEQWQR